MRNTASSSGAYIYVLGNASQAVLINSGAGVRSDKRSFNVHSTQNSAFIINSGAATTGEGDVVAVRLVN